jgi:hypothetical protein
MLGSNDFVTIRRLPDGTAQTAQVSNRAPGRLALAAVGDEPVLPFEAGALVEIDSPEAVYLGEVIGRHQDSLVTVAVEHFIDRAALAEIEKVWNSTEGACHDLVLPSSKA